MLEIFQRENLNVLRIYGVRGNRCACKIPACGSPGKHPAPWPREKINRGVYSARPADTVTESDFEDYNIGVACGGGLVVIDIDPRNGGHLTWMELSAGKDIGDTLEVSTGGGGRHIYYRANGIKSMSFGGIDVQSEGKYVVAPPSRHVTGKTYDWTEGETIAPMPQWLLDHILSHSQKIELSLAPQSADAMNYVPADHEWPWIHEILEKLTPRIGYHNWLGVGMGLHATGHSDAFRMWDEWSRKDPQQYVLGECKHKWNSFRMRGSLDRGHTYRWIFAMAELYNIKYGNGATLDWNSDITVTPHSVCTAKDFESLNHGRLLTHLQKIAHGFVSTKNSKLCLATALQTLSAAAQGSYLSPTKHCLNLYQWIAATASYGKTKYINVTKKMIASIHENLVAPSIGTNKGFRPTFQGFNSLVKIEDEWQEHYLSVSQAKQENYKLLLKDYLELHNGPQKLERYNTKGGSEPEVILPTLSILGFSTIEGVKKCSGEDGFISTGFARRFLFWFAPVMNTTVDFETEEAFDENSQEFQDLREIFLRGAHGNTIRRSREVESEIYEIASSGKLTNKRGQIKQLPPPQTIMKRDTVVPYANAEAKKMFNAYTNECVVQAGKTEVTSEDYQSIVNAKYGFVNKLMTLRALSDYTKGGPEPEVTTEHVAWAIAVVDMLTHDTIETFELSEGATGFDAKVLRNAQRIMKTLAHKGDGCTKEELLASNRSIAKDTMNKCLEHLVACGLVGIVDRQGNLTYPERIPLRCRIVSVNRV
jgi:hypothetical protein